MVGSRHQTSGAMPSFLSCGQLFVLFIAAIIMSVASTVIGATADRVKPTERTLSRRWMDLLSLLGGKQFPESGQRARYAALGLMIIASVLMVAVAVAVGTAYVNGAEEICGFAF